MDQTPSAAGPRTIGGLPEARLYVDGELVATNLALEGVSKLLDAPGSVVWLDLCSPTQSDLDTVAAEFGLHELAVEDALHEHQRPKFDRYDRHSFLAAYAVRIDADTGEIESTEIDAFMADRALITVRNDDRFDFGRVCSRWDQAAELAIHGVGFLLWGLLDELVDGHFAAVQQLDDSLDVVQEKLFADSAEEIATVQRRTFELRKTLVELRRIVLPMREVLNTVMRRDLHFVDVVMMPYFQDVYDHVLRATEWTESLRDLVSTILETNLSIQGNRMNLIMKKVTSWAAIIAVPTAITGFFGQNVPYPGFGHESGLIGSFVSMGVISVVLYLIFRARDWL